MLSESTPLCIGVGKVIFPLLPTALYFHMGKLFKPHFLYLKIIFFKE